MVLFYVSSFQIALTHAKSDCDYAMTSALLDVNPAASASTNGGPIAIIDQKYGVETLFVDQDGTVVFAANGSDRVGTNILKDPNVASAIAQLPNTNDAVFVVNASALPFAKDQCIVEARHVYSCNLDLVIINDHPQIFVEQRKQMATLVFVLMLTLGLVLFFITYLIALYRRRLLRLATTDEVTNLANRKSFVALYEREAQEGRLAQSCAMLIDVDFFKRVNDSFGHAVGDEALRYVADRVSALVNGRGLCGRWGGDEFIAVIELPMEAARVEIERMISDIAAGNLEDGLKLSVSVGAVEVEEGAALNNVVEKADEALYVSKKNGRGFLTVYEEGVTPKVVYDDGTGNKQAAASNADAAKQATKESAAVEKVGERQPAPVVAAQVVAPQAVSTQAQAVPAKRVAPTASTVVDNLHTEHEDLTFDATTAPKATRGDVKFIDLLRARLFDSLLAGVYAMVPFVVGGGLLIACAFLIDGASVDYSSLTLTDRVAFGTITPLAGGIHAVGALAFGFIMPIFTARFAASLAGNEAYMAGFVGGYMVASGNAGFVGGVIAGVIAALVVHVVRDFMGELSHRAQSMTSIIVYPLFSLLVTYLALYWVIDPIMASVNGWLTAVLEDLSHGNHVLLGAVLGAFMAADLGGPVNKAAYVFGTTMATAGYGYVMPAVMLGGMVPPIAMALAIIFGKKWLPKRNRESAPGPMLVLGLSFITEGVLPFALADLLHVIPACIVGSATASALGVAFGCELLATHGGVFVFPVAIHPVLMLTALAVGSVVGAACYTLMYRLKARRQGAGKNEEAVDEQRSSASVVAQADADAIE